MKLPKNRLITIFQLIIVTIIMLTLLGIAVQHISIMLLKAERNVVQSSIGNMRRALTYHQAILLAKGKDLTLLLKANPLDLMVLNGETHFEDTPGGGDKAITAGPWHFDKSLNELVFNVHFKDYFRTVPPGQFDIKLRIIPQYKTMEKTGGTTIKALKLGIISPYQWCTEPGYFGCKKWGKINR